MHVLYVIAIIRIIFKLNIYSVYDICVFANFLTEMSDINKGTYNYSSSQHCHHQYIIVIIIIISNTITAVINFDVLISIYVR